MMPTERESQVQTDRWAAWQGGMGPRPVIVKTDEIKNGHYQKPLANMEQKTTTIRRQSASSLHQAKTAKKE